MLEELFCAHRAELTAYCRGLCRSDAAAQDMVQEVFLRAWQNIGTLQDLGPSQRRAWLYRTARNLFVDAMRRTAREAAALPELEVISAGDAPHICAVTLPSYKSEVLVRVLGDRGVCLSSGSACHKGKPSHVYAALGLPKAWLDGALRISFDAATTQAEIDVLVRELKAAKEGLFPTLS